jgi:hypothetical protein
MQAFGRYLHHSPDSILDLPMDVILTDTLAVVDAHGLPMTLFTADTDAGLDDGYHWSSTDLGRMRDANTALVETRRKRRCRGDGSGIWSAGIFGGDGGGGHDGGGGCGGGGCGGGGCGGGG